MGFPDRIERVLEVDNPLPEVWSALTTPEGLRGWFSDEVTLDLRPGGAAQLTWNGSHAPVMRVERVEPMTVFGFSWPINGSSKDSVPRTYVEFTLEELEHGTRVTVVESGFAQLPDDTYGTTYPGHVEGWGRELGELVAYLAGR